MLYVGSQRRHLLLLSVVKSPSSWPDDLDIRMWPSYSVLAHQKWSFYRSGLSKVRAWTGRTDTHTRHTDNLHLYLPVTLNLSRSSCCSLKEVLATWILSQCCLRHVVGQQIVRDIDVLHYVVYLLKYTCSLCSGSNNANLSYKIRLIKDR